MSFNLENSFIATATSIAGGHFHFPRLSIGKTCYATESRGPALYRHETRVDISSKLCVKHSSKVVPLKFYFQCIGDHYAMFVLTPGVFQHHTITNDKEDYLSACNPDIGERTLFNLLNRKKEIITLSNIDGDTATVFMKTTNDSRCLTARLRSTQGYALSTGTKGGTPLEIKLHIVERNILY